jgi:hypothetical protein
MIINVVPINDEVAHVENESCWCKPRVEENGQLIIHNSFDGREDFEEITVRD